MNSTEDARHDCENFNNPKKARPAHGALWSQPKTNARRQQHSGTPSRRGAMRAATQTAQTIRAAGAAGRWQETPSRWGAAFGGNVVRATAAATAAMSATATKAVATAAVRWVVAFAVFVFASAAMTAFAAADSNASASASNATAAGGAPAAGTISIHATIPPSQPTETRALVAADAQQNALIQFEEGNPNLVTSTVSVAARVLQGSASKFTFAFTGAGSEGVGQVTGDNVAAWEVRRTKDGGRLLDIFTRTPVRASDAPFTAEVRFSVNKAALRRDTIGASADNSSAVRFPLPVLSRPPDAAAAATKPTAESTADSTATASAPSAEKGGAAAAAFASFTGKVSVFVSGAEADELRVVVGEGLLRAAPSATKPAASTRDSDDDSANATDDVSPPRFEANHPTLVKYGVNAGVPARVPDAAKRVSSKAPAFLFLLDGGASAAPARLWFKHEKKTATLENLALSGVFDPASGNILFELNATARASAAGSTLNVLSGDVALLENNTATVLAEDTAAAASAAKSGTGVSSVSPQPATTPQSSAANVATGQAGMPVLPSASAPERSATSTSAARNTGEPPVPLSAAARNTGEPPVPLSPSYQIGLAGENYALRFNKAGSHAIRLRFVSKVSRTDNVSRVAFTIPGVAVAPFALRGFPAGTEFFASAGMPALTGDAAKGSVSGFLSAQGTMALSWGRAAAAAAGADARLFFSTEEVTEISVSPGLLRQLAQFRYKVLQGNLETLRFALDGAGEILRVTGDDILSWKIEDAPAAAATSDNAAAATATAAAAPPAAAPRKHLVVRLAKPKSGDYALTVEVRAPLGVFPVKTAPLSIAPLDGVRHGGFVQVTNDGAVRIEATPRAGLAQVAPALFPSRNRVPDATQRFVYRVAGADTALDILADNILPETGVSALTLYRVAESGVTVDVEAELEVRESPLSEFTLLVPAAFSVSQTAQLDEWSHTLAAVKDGAREMRIAFARPLLGRGVIRFTLEQNQDVAAAESGTQSSAQSGTGGSPVSPTPTPTPYGARASRPHGEAGIGGDNFAPVSATAPQAGGTPVPLPTAAASTGEPPVPLSAPLPAATLALAPVGFPGAKSVRGHVGVIAASGLRVTPVSASGLVEIAPAFFPRRDPGLQQAWRVRDPAWRAAVNVAKLDLAVQTDALHLFAVREAVVAATSTINYAITGAPLGEFRFAAPSGVLNLEFTGRDIRAWRHTGDTIVLSLHKPVSGALTLLASYDQKIDPSGGDATLTGLRPLGVQSESGLVLVTSDLQFNVRREAVSPELLELESGEIPAEYRLMFTAPLLGAWQYAARPFDLRLHLAPRPQSATLNQEAEFASLATRVSADGQMSTDARYLVKSHGRPNLRLTLPAGLSLRTARVDGADVLPVMDGCATLVPLPPRADANAALTVDLRFAGNPSAAADGSRAAGEIRLEAPRLDAPVLNTRWEISPDEGSALVPVGGNLALKNPPPAAPSWRDYWKTPAAGRGVKSLGIAGALALLSAILFRVAREVRARRRLLPVLVLCVAGGILSMVAAFLGLSHSHGEFGSIAGQPAPAAPAPVASQSIEKLPAPKPPDSGVLIYTAPFHEGAAGAADAASVPHRVILGRAEKSGGGFAAIAGHILFALAGIAFFARAFLRKSAAFRAVAWTWFGVGIFAGPASHYGWFAALAACFFFFELFLPGVFGCLTPPKSDAPAAAAARGSTLAALALLALSGVSALAPAPLRAASSAPMHLQSIAQDIRVTDAEVSATATAFVRGGAGEFFNMLDAPAVLTAVRHQAADGREVEGLPAGARFVRVNAAKGNSCLRLVLDKPAAFRVTLDYRCVLSGQSFTLPTAAALVDEAVVSIAGADFRLESARAALIAPRAAPATAAGKAVSVFEVRFTHGSGARVLAWAPKARDRAAESLVLYAETADLYTPALGVLNGAHSLVIRPAQGLLGDVAVRIPDGLSVSAVHGRHVQQWRFDPAARRLRVRLGAPLATETVLVVETQRGLGALPAKIALAPLVVETAAGQVGMMALGASDDVQVTSADAARMLPVSKSDFAFNTGGVRDVKIADVSRRAWRYAGADAALSAVIEAVKPEIRLEARQRVSIGEDRTVLNANWSVDITRAGVFRLTFDLPRDLEVESISGSSLSHWTESGTGVPPVVTQSAPMAKSSAAFSRANGVHAAPAAPAAAARRITLHLRGRTLGRQDYSLTFAGSGIAGKKTWEAPRLVLEEASRQTGTIELVPEEGVRLHATARAGATPYDPGSQSRLPRSALAFLLPQRDWRLVFDIENLAPWIQVAHVQDLAVRDGQVRATAHFEYSIENAATKLLRIALPAAATSVRFTGAHVADAVRLPDATAAAPATAAAMPPDSALWEIRLARRILGKATLQATYTLPLKTPAAPAAAEAPVSTDATAAAPPLSAKPATPPAAALFHATGISATDAGLQNGWLSLRATGRLELRPGAMPSTLATSDWQAVPASLRRGLTEPDTVLRVIEPAYTLPVSAAAHDPARLLAIRVEKADLVTLLSNDRRALTRVHLVARPAGKTLLRVTLPPDGSTYWHAFVNDEPVRVSRDGDALLLPVAPNPEDGKPATIEFYYANGAAAAPAAGNVNASAAAAAAPLERRLQGPRFDVPLENIVWRVQLPDGTHLERHTSDLRQVPATPLPAEAAGMPAPANASDYLASNKRALEAKHQQARRLLSLGNHSRTLNQTQAVQALNAAAILSKGDNALNEDARVQLNNLRQEQIEVGMGRWSQNFNSNASQFNGGVGVGGGGDSRASGLSQNAVSGSPSQVGAGTLVVPQTLAYTQDEIASQRRQRTAEENEITRKMAERLLQQQTTVAATPDSIRTQIPAAAGVALQFERTLQVVPGADLSLTLHLAPPPVPAPTGPSIWHLLLALLFLLPLTLLLPRITRR